MARGISEEFHDLSHPVLGEDEYIERILIEFSILDAPEPEGVIIVTSNNWYESDA